MNIYLSMKLFSLEMSEIRFPDKQLTELRAFVTLLKSQPSVLHQPELLFFKEFVESLGGIIPPLTPKSEFSKACPAHESHTIPQAASDEEQDIDESDVELDQSGVIGT